MAHNHVILGFGPLGRSVARALIEEGHQPRVITRSGKALGVPTEVELVQGDISKYLELHGLTQGAEVMYQCAQPPYTRWPQEFPAMQESILKVAESRNIKVVLGENLYCYGKPPGGVITDSTPCNPQETKGRVRFSMSQEAKKLHTAGKVEIANVQASDFFGPWAWEQSHLGNRALGPVSQGKPAKLIGKATIPHTFTYVHDFGKAMAHIGLQNKGWGQTWLVPNNNPEMSQKERLEIAAKILNKPLKVQTAGKKLLSFVSFFSPIVKEIIPMLYQFEEPYVVDSTLFTSTFGLNATPIEQALSETIEWARNQGYLE